MKPQWIALTNTTLGVLMAGINTSIVLIAHCRRPPPSSPHFSATIRWAHMLPPAVLAHLSPALRAHLLARSFFPHLIGPPLMEGLRFAFYIADGMSLVAAIASQLRGARPPATTMAPAEEQRCQRHAAE